MLLPLLCTLIVSTQLGLSLVVKSLFLLFLGPGNQMDMLSNITTVYSNSSNISNSSNTNIQFILGTYNLESSSNFDSYLQEMGVSYFLRQLAQLAQPSVTFDINCHGKNMTRDSDSPKDEGGGGEVEDDAKEYNDIDTTPLSSPLCLWSIHTDAGIKIHDIVFTIGEEVTEDNIDTNHDDHGYVAGKGHHHGWQGGYQQVLVVPTKHTHRGADGREHQHHPH